MLNRRFASPVCWTTARGSVHRPGPLLLAGLTAVALNALPLPQAAADILTVHPDGSGEYPNIQDAIYNASDGDVVELTDGTFTGFGNRDILFWGRAITVRSQSGDPLVCIVDLEGDIGDPHRGFAFEEAEGPSSVIEGITIRNAWIGDLDNGGGLRCRAGSAPTITGCRIVDCEGGGGPAIWCDQSAATIEDCLFSGNSSFHGGAVIQCTNGSPVIRRCVFADNASGGESGAIQCNLGSVPVIEDCVFIGNTSFVASAIRCIDDATATLTRCTITHNRGSSGGGVVVCSENAVATITGSIIAFDDDAPAISCLDNAQVLMSCCDVFGNAGGDWVDCIAAQLDQDGNFAADPQFCSTAPEADLWWALQSDSPCVAGNHPAGAECGTLGAPATTCGTTAVETTTWGAIKASFE